MTICVPQRSVLRPTLFLLFNNYLDKRIEDSQRAMFAYDITVIKGKQNGNLQTDSDAIKCEKLR